MSNRLTIRLGRTAAAGAMALVLTLGGVAHGADPDSKLLREREMLRRAQESLRQSQADNAELARAKVEAEQKLKEATAQIDAARSASKSAQSSQSALHTQLQTATASQTELTQKLDDANRQLLALGARQKETAGQLSTSESQLRQVRQDLESSRATNNSCEAKNLQLYQYSQDLVQRYEKKGVWAALTQKEPVFGIREVGMQNVVQEYQEKLAIQKIAAPPGTAALPAAGAAAR